MRAISCTLECRICKASLGTSTQIGGPSPSKLWSSFQQKSPEDGQAMPGLSVQHWPAANPNNPKRVMTQLLCLLLSRKPFKMSCVGIHDDALPVDRSSKVFADSEPAACNASFNCALTAPKKTGGPWELGGATRYSLASTKLDSMRKFQGAQGAAGMKQEDEGALKAAGVVHPSSFTSLWPP